MQAGFYRVDHDYVIGTADLAKAGGCKQFHLVSSVGADSTSCVLYARTKVNLQIKQSHDYILPITVPFALPVIHFSLFFD